MEGDVPDSDVRTVYEAGGVGERQDENRRCGDACDSLCHWDEEAVAGLGHRRLGPDRDPVVDSPLVVVGVDTDLEVGSCPKVGREPRISAFARAEDTERDHHAEAALAPSSSDADRPCVLARRFAPVRRPV